MRSEFRIFNIHAHISAVTNEEVNVLEESAYQKLNLVVLVVFTCGVNKVAGL